GRQACSQVAAAPRTRCYAKSAASSKELSFRNGHCSRQGRAQVTFRVEKPDLERSAVAQLPAATQRFVQRDDSSIDIDFRLRLGILGGKTFAFGVQQH